MNVLKNNIRFSQTLQLTTYVFVIKIGQELSTPMTEHPNQFYQESVHGGPKTGTSTSNIARAQLKTERTNVYETS